MIGEDAGIAAQQAAQRLGGGFGGVGVADDVERGPAQAGGERRHEIGLGRLGDARDHGHGGAGSERLAQPAQLGPVGEKGQKTAQCQEGTSNEWTRKTRGMGGWGGQADPADPAESRDSRMPPVPDAAGAAPDGPDGVVPAGAGSDARGLGTGALAVVGTALTSPIPAGAIAGGAIAGGAIAGGAIEAIHGRLGSFVQRAEDGVGGALAGAVQLDAVVEGGTAQEEVNVLVAAALRPPDANLHAREASGTAEVLDDAFQAVLATRGAARPHAHLAERQVEVIADDEQAGQIDLVEAHQLAHRQAAIVHVRLRLGEDGLLAVEDPFGEERAAALAGPRPAETPGQQVHRVEADIVSSPGVAHAWISQADDQFHSGSSSIATHGLPHVPTAAGRLAPRARQQGRPLAWPPWCSARRGVASERPSLL